MTIEIKFSWHRVLDTLTLMRELAPDLQTLLATVKSFPVENVTTAKYFALT